MVSFGIGSSLQLDELIIELGRSLTGTRFRVRIELVKTRYRIALAAHSITVNVEPTEVFLVPSVGLAPIALSR